MAICFSQFVYFYRRGFGCIGIGKQDAKFILEPGAAKQHFGRGDVGLKGDFIFIRADGKKIFKIMHHDLLFAEASGNYTKVVTTQKTYLPNITFSNFEDLLPKSVFLRIQRPLIINKSKITYIEGNRVFIDKTEIPIGSNYKEAF